MLFNSLHFVLFFLGIHLVYWKLPDRFKKYWILAASFFFYAYYSVPFLFHFLLVVTVNYLIVRSLFQKRRKWLFVTGVVLNLLNLAFFKYTNSFLSGAALHLGIKEALQLKDWLGIVLPFAISFYTFQLIAFLVDTWRGEIREVSPANFAFFILFFPHFIAGPIMRHKDFLYQIDRVQYRKEDTVAGLYLIALGAVKKVVIGDEAGLIIQPIWASPEKFDTISILFAIFGFSIHVYCDFSGYTDMARGLARLLGYSLPENFFFPYLSTSFRELWTRWHVTLSTWLRDYLFIPLGGSRVHPVRAYANMLIVMSLGGLWHGDTYTFFLWGLSHGIFLTVERFLVGKGKWPDTLSQKILGWIIVFIGWHFAVVFFRAPSIENAWKMFTGLFLNAGETAPKIENLLQLGGLTLGLQMLQMYRSRFEFFLKQNAVYALPVIAVILYFLIARIERPAEQFIYFTF